MLLQGGIPSETFSKKSEHDSFLKQSQTLRKAGVQYKEPPSPCPPHPSPCALQTCILGSTRGHSRAQAPPSLAAHPSSIQLSTPAGTPSPRPLPDTGAGSQSVLMPVLLLSLYESSCSAHLSRNFTQVPRPRSLLPTRPGSRWSLSDVHSEPSLGSLLSSPIVRVPSPVWFPNLSTSYSVTTLEMLQLSRWASGRPARWLPGPPDTSPSVSAYPPACRHRMARPVLSPWPCNQPFSGSPSSLQWGGGRAQGWVRLLTGAQRTELRNKWGRTHPRGQHSLRGPAAPPHPPPDSRCAAHGSLPLPSPWDSALTVGSWALWPSACSLPTAPPARGRSPRLLHTGAPPPPLDGCPSTATPGSCYLSVDVCS